MADVRIKVQCDPVLHGRKTLIDPKIKRKSIEPMEAKTLPSPLSRLSHPVTEFPENPVTLHRAARKEATKRRIGECAPHLLRAAASAPQLERAPCLPTLPGRGAIRHRLATGVARQCIGREGLPDAIVGDLSVASLYGRVVPRESVFHFRIRIPRRRRMRLGVRMLAPGEAEFSPVDGAVPSWIGLSSSGSW